MPMLTFWKQRLLGQRGDATLERWMASCPKSLLRTLARRRRRSGCYDRRSLRQFQWLWRSTHSGEALLDFLLFRRDLGRPPAHRLAGPLLQRLNSLSVRRRRLALGLLAEAGVPELWDLPAEWLADAVQHSAGMNKRTLPDSSGSPWLKTLAVEQTAWRESFAAAVRNTHSLCVVGNAGHLRGSGLGATIDHHQMVMRFNRFQGPESSAADIGRKLSVWVASPEVIQETSQTASWIVISGPDMLYQMRRWDSLKARLEEVQPVLTVPLGCWADLVKDLQAPPSAGVLMLHWLHAIRGHWQGITATGFSTGQPDSANYHHADSRHQPSSRHNWEAERFLLQRWAGEGLVIWSTEAGQ